MHSFKMIFSKVTILRGIEFPIFLLILHEPCNSAALNVFSRKTSISSNTTRNVATTNALQLEIVRRRVSRSRLFWLILYCTNGYFAASDQKSDIVIRFSDRDFLQEKTTFSR